MPLGSGVASALPTGLYEHLESTPLIRVLDRYARIFGKGRDTSTEGSSSLLGKLIPTLTRSVDHFKAPTRSLPSPPLWSIETVKSYKGSENGQQRQNYREAQIQPVKPSIATHHTRKMLEIIRSIRLDPRIRPLPHHHPHTRCYSLRRTRVLHDILFLPYSLFFSLCSACFTMISV